jgi:hypothetical protein
MGMGCDREKILQYVEGDLGPEDAARLRTHVGQCAACHKALEAEKELASALGGLDDVDCPEDFATTTVTRARCDLTHAVSSPRERGRAILFSGALSGLAVFLLWPFGLLDPLVRALGPIPCITRCIVSGLAQSGMGALMVCRAVSRHFFEQNDASTVALVMLAVLVVLLGLLLRRYHLRGVVKHGDLSR